MAPKPAVIFFAFTPTAREALRLPSNQVTGANNALAVCKLLLLLLLLRLETRRRSTPNSASTAAPHGGELETRRLRVRPKPATEARH